MKNNKLFIIIILIILITIVLGSTYAYIQIGNPTNQIQGQAGCFVVDYQGQAGQFDNVEEDKLSSSESYSSGGVSTVTLSKNSECLIYSEANIVLHTNDSTSADLLSEGALKYSVITGTNTQIVSGTIESNGDLTLKTVELTTTPTTYTIYIWIDSDITYNSSKVYDGLQYSGYIYATSTQESTYNP